MFYETLDVRSVWRSLVGAYRSMLALGSSLQGCTVVPSGILELSGPFVVFQPFLQSVKLLLWNSDLVFSDFWHLSRKGQRRFEFSLGYE